MNISDDELVNSGGLDGIPLFEVPDLEHREDTMPLKLKALYDEGREMYDMAIENNGQLVRSESVGINYIIQSLLIIRQRSAQDNYPKVYVARRHQARQLMHAEGANQWQ
ncbi:MAG TPA: hypothetical protein VJK03_02250 [Candidatus Nanoarchaeia archaeon]|nr:hypothetical protein [Candidatus Nanoarchaeia archaeon]